MASAVSVLVASSDAAFRRLAGAGLSRAGAEVETVTAGPMRVERLLRLRRPQVVVLDAACASFDQVRARIGELPDPPAVVLVAEQPAAGMLAKWGPLEALVAEVQRAAGEHDRRVPGRPLRLVEPES